MKTQPPFSLADSCLTQQELPFYSHSPEGSVGWGDTQETRGEDDSSHLLPGEVGEVGGGPLLPWASHRPWEGGFLSAEEPFIAGLTRKVCRQVSFLYWVPGLRPRSQSTSNQRLERIKAERQLQRSP